MVALKRNVPVTKRVWRITVDSPSGEFVAVDGARSSSPKADKLADGGWFESSYDLAHGLEISEIRVSALADPGLTRPQSLWTGPVGLASDQDVVPAPGSWTNR